MRSRPHFTIIALASLALACTTSGHEDEAEHEYHDENETDRSLEWGILQVNPDKDKTVAQVEADKKARKSNIGKAATPTKSSQR